MAALSRFHLAFPVIDLEQARDFYSRILGCATGRESDRWIDFDFFGHQLVIHQKEDFEPQQISNPVDGHQVPVPHFGVVLNMKEWNILINI